MDTRWPSGVGCGKRSSPQTRTGAVALLPALLTAALPQVSVRRLADERLQRTVFTATRSTTTDAPAVVAVRTALHQAAAAAATNRDDIDVMHVAQVR